jgi:hypothetical protein
MSGATPCQRDWRLRATALGSDALGELVTPEYDGLPLIVTARVCVFGFALLRRLLETSLLLPDLQGDRASGVPGPRPVRAPRAPDPTATPPRPGGVACGHRRDGTVAPAGAG